MKTILKTAISSFAFIASLPCLQAALQVQITVENLANSGGVYFGPMWLGFHDGSFDYYDVGSSASASTEALAETGNSSGINTDFGSADGRMSTTLVAPTGIGPGIYSPGSSASFTITLDETQNRYLSFASMVVPSNDAFIGNDDPMGLELFDLSGNFNGTQTFTMLGADIMDSGTELNDTFGAAFTTKGGTSTDESMMIGMHAGLDNFIGEELGDLTFLTEAFTSTSPIASISITAVPEPETYAAIFGVIALGFAIHRKRKTNKA